MRTKDMEVFRKRLLDKKKLLIGDVNHMKEETLSKSRMDASGDLSAMPLHMADIGSENYDQEFTLGLLEAEEQEVREIDEALKRIDNKIYGKCEGCARQITKLRLKAIPYSRLCIKCKQEEEEQAGNA